MIKIENEKAVYERILENYLAGTNFQKACASAGYWHVTINNRYPNWYPQIRSIRYKNRRSRKVSPWMKYNMFYRLFVKGEYMKDIAQHYNVHDQVIRYHTDAIMKKYKPLRYNFYHEIETKLGQKSESYWQNEDEIGFKTAKLCDLSKDELKIYFNS